MTNTKLELTTKQFGNIVIAVDSNGHGNSEAMYGGEEINIFLSDYRLYGDKAKACLNVIDRYKELDEIARKSIVAGFADNATIRFYFEDHFDNYEKEDLIDIFGVSKFGKMDIKQVVEKLEYSDLLFSIKDDELQISVDYMVSEEHYDEI